MLYSMTLSTESGGGVNPRCATWRCEVGTHSPWVSRLRKGLGHEVFVANARQVRLISQSSRKNDKLDARMLAKLVRTAPELLRPSVHLRSDALAFSATSASSTQ